jgi:hypothetical protein
MSQAALFNTARFPAASSSIAPQRAARSGRRSVHAKAVRLQQASLQLAGAPGQRGDQPREPGWAADCGACSDEDGDTAAGHGGQRPGGLAQTPTTVVHLSGRTRIELRRPRSWLSPSVRFCRIAEVCAAVKSDARLKRITRRRGLPGSEVRVGPRRGGYPEVGVAAHGEPGRYLSLARLTADGAWRLRLALSQEPSVTRPRPAAKMSRLTRP